MTAKMFTKDSRAPQKLQVTLVVLGADPGFCFPWLLSAVRFVIPLGLGSQLTLCGSGVRDFTPCQAKGRVA